MLVYSKRVVNDLPLPRQIKLVQLCPPGLSTNNHIRNLHPHGSGGAGRVRSGYAPRLSAGSQLVPRLINYPMVARLPVGALCRSSDRDVPSAGHTSE